MAAPFSLRIFVADGDPDGLRVVERSNWCGKALVFPRAVWPTVRRRPECELPGVYMLIGPATEGEGESLYIGEGDPVRPRLENHAANKDFWTRAVFFTAKDFLNKTCIQYLESRLVSLAREAKRVKLENGNAPAEPSIGEADRADMETFLAHMLAMLPVLGVHAFARPEPVAAAPADTTVAPDTTVAALRTLLTCSGKGVTATGYDGTEGFVVLAGSTMVAAVAPSLVVNHPWVVQERQALLSRGVVVPAGGVLRFEQAYAFNSPSGAAAAILGRPSNGRTEWKDSLGRTLKDLQSAQS